MFYPRESKRFITIGLAITSLTLITIFYISNSSNSNYFDFPKFQLYNTNNYTQSINTTRICCLILTTPKNFLTRAKAIHDTWGPLCDRHFFITENSSESNSVEQINITRELPIAPITNIIPGYDHLTQKSVSAFLFAYQNYINDFDWFVKADDDTFIIVENLRAFLSKQNTSEPVTFGYNFKVIVPKGYHSGGASYVLSKESLRRFYTAHTNPNSSCRKDGGAEDVEVAKCLRNEGVYPGKSLDDQNRELFHPLPFHDHFRGSFPDWMLSYAENPLEAKYGCCGDQTISFHYVSPEDQYLMHFLLYKIRPISPIHRRSIDRFARSTAPVTS
ncbi:unnamed protein product [Adineta ricciae]|uniref:N-acetylgalactosaminide beta-1,3-galactosyltransferase n=1 Tax=Adineta ricciae TaxID=249248 RepID=A0A813PUE9_ADIRI|nr:unnamed protein product [Adineta ricciae]